MLIGGQSMIRALRMLAVAAILGAGSSAGVLGETGDPVVRFHSDDAEMAAAQSKARATLAQFWQAHEHPGSDESGFALKVAVPVSRSNIWMNDIERQDGKITGVVNNVPHDAKWLREGQRVAIREERISDWMFMRAGKIVGNETLRPILKRLPPPEAARLRAMLEEP